MKKKVKEVLINLAIGIGFGAFFWGFFINAIVKGLY